MRGIGNEIFFVGFMKSHFAIIEFVQYYGQSINVLYKKFGGFLDSLCSLTFTPSNTPRQQSERYPHIEMPQFCSHEKL